MAGSEEMPAAVAARAAAAMAGWSLARSRPQGTRYSVSPSAAEEAEVVLAPGLLGPLALPLLLQLVPLPLSEEGRCSAMSCRQVSW